MTDALHKELKLERYHQLVESALAERVPMALCDAQGDCVWASDGDAPNGISTLLTALIAFPAYMMHRVTPVEGTRRRIVALYCYDQLAGTTFDQGYIEELKQGLPQ